jgi:hypothetical protein
MDGDDTQTREDVMGAVKEKYLNNIRYADKSAVIDLFEFPDEPDDPEQAEDDAEDQMCQAEHTADCMEDR